MTYTKRKVGFNSRGSVGKPWTRCSHCNRPMNDYAGGSSKGYNGENLCHPNAKNRPDCYALVTRYGHETPCQSKTCYEDHAELMTYVRAHENYSEKVPF